VGYIARLRERRRSGERGAALVEFAILTPLLLLLVIGIVEFGWLFAQFNAVRHSAREGARYAAVNAGGNTAIEQRICQSLDGVSAGIINLSVTLTDGSGGAVGTTGQVTVVAAVSSLSGAPLISSFLPPQLASSVEFRLEQPSDSWSTATNGSVSC
jgi:Flp pilus assembly protein TadG